MSQPSGIQIRTIKLRKGTTIVDAKSVVDKGHEQTAIKSRNLEHGSKWYDMYQGRPQLASSSCDDALAAALPLLWPGRVQHGTDGLIKDVLQSLLGEGRTF